MSVLGAFLRALLAPPRPRVPRVPACPGCGVDVRAGEHLGDPLDWTGDRGQTWACVGCGEISRWVMRPGAPVCLVWTGDNRAPGRP